MAMLEPHSGRGEPVKIRRLIRLAAIGGDALVSEVIRHVQNTPPAARTGGRPKHKLPNR